MLYPPEFPGLGFFLVLYILSPFCHPLVCKESYAGGLSFLSLQTPGTALAVPWDTKVKPALETPGDLS